MQGMLINALYNMALLAGFAILCKGLWALLIFLRIAFTRLNGSWTDKYGKGSWALVTGCTEGIGRAFCYQLASLGFHLVLVSRNQQKLQILSKQLWKQYPNLNILICQTDFSTYNRSMYDKIMDKIKNLDLSLLINNVGIAHTKKLDHQTTKEIEEQINVNIAAMTFLTHRIVPLFLERKKKCGIVNLSSLSITFSLRTLSVYTGTKAYNDNFSRCISQDYKGVIDIVDCVAGIVSTAGTNYTSDPLSCTSEGCARWSLKALGVTDSTAGHWTHILQNWSTLIIGPTISRMIANIKMKDVTSFKKE